MERPRFNGERAVAPLESIDGREGRGYRRSSIRLGGFVRAIGVIMAGCLAAGCALPAVGAYRADGAGTAPDPAPAGTRSQGLRDNDRLDGAAEVAGCLGQVAVIGGVAAVIYFQRFRGSAGGGDGVANEPPVPDAEAGIVSTTSATPVPGWAMPRLSPEAAAIVEQDAGAPFRPCGSICTGGGEVASP